MRRRRNVKIVATLGPASRDAATIKRLFEAGADVFRINMSHTDHAGLADLVAKIRSVEAELDRPIGILADLQGPKLRIGAMAGGGVDLETGSQVRIDLDARPGDAHHLYLPHKEVFAVLKEGGQLLIDDGRIRLRLLKVASDHATAIVDVGGRLTDRKGVNVPDAVLPIAALTAKDRADLDRALEHGVDWIALSFVQRPEDVADARKIVAGRAGVLSKIEKPSAIERLHEIIELSDAVMVARGDLGVELPVEQVPGKQKVITRAARAAGKPVVVATQMLESMISSPIPTRAEVSDVATAVFDGADAVMLSGETSVGQYPIEAITVMDRIIRKTEEQRASREQFNPDRIASTHAYDPLARSACALADYIGSSVIVTITYSGVTAAQVAKFRPPSRIIGVTDREKILRRLNLIWGVRGMTVENLKKDTDVTFKMIQKKLLKEGYVKKGDIIVMMAGLPLFEGHPTNTIKVVTA